MSPSDIEPTLPDDDRDDRSSDEKSRSDQEKETTAIPRFDPGGGRTEKTVVAGPNEDVVPGYQMVSKLGEGGMGVVYKAVQRSLNREVALKIMKSLGDDESFVARFRREAITGARLNHPNIVGVYDHGQHQGSVYLVLEFVRGRNCAELLDEMKRLPLKDALEITRGAVLGLSHAHHEGVIHRDIKPANLMVVEGVSGDARRRSRQITKVADFGLARLHDSREDPDHQDLTQAGSVMGTPGYMAPEQALGKPVDFRADIYSLGSTLYCLITGAKPFQGNTVVELLHKKMNEFALDPRDLVEDVPEGVVRVIDRMMAKNADDRYQSYENLLHDLDKLLGGEEPATAPVEAHSRSIGPPMGKTIAVPEQGGARSGESSILRPPRSRSGKLALAGLLIVAVVAVTGFAIFGGKGEPDDAPPALAAITKDLEGWATQGHESFLESAGRNWQSLDAALAGAGTAEAEELRSAFRRRLTAALEATTTTAITGLEERWQDRAWSLLGADCAARRSLHEIAGSTPPRRLDELTAFAAAGAGAAGAAEKRRAEQLLGGRSPVLADLEAFQRDYAFSPDRPRIAALIDELAQARNLRAEIELEIDQLEGLEPEEFFAASHALADLDRRVGSLAADEGRSTLEARLNRIRKTKAETLLAATHDELDAVFEARDWIAMKAQVELMTGICEKNGVEVPDWLAEHRRNVAAATPSKRTAEKAAWDEIAAVLAAEDPDPILLIGLLGPYLDRYADMSPTVDEARAALERARTEAPVFRLTVEPRDARVQVNGVLKGGPTIELPLRKGKVTIVAEADGHFTAERLIDHQAGGLPLVLKLSPKPERRLAVMGVNNVPLHRNPMSSDLPFPISPGCQLNDTTDPVAGIRFSSEKTGWRTTSRSMFDNPIARRIFRDGSYSGWQLRGVISVERGEAEIRVLDDGRDASVVIGMAKGKLHLAERQGDDLRAVADVVIPDDCRALRFALNWESGVAVLMLVTGDDPMLGNADRVVAGLRPGFTPRARGDITLAIRKGETSFGELELYPMN